MKLVKMTNRAFQGIFSAICNEPNAANNLVVPTPVHRRANTVAKATGTLNDDLTAPNLACALRPIPPTIWQC